MLDFFSSTSRDEISASENCELCNLWNLSIISEIETIRDSAILLSLLDSEMMTIRNSAIRLSSLDSEIETIAAVTKTAYITEAIVSTYAPLIIPFFYYCNYYLVFFFKHTSKIKVHFMWFELSM